MFSHFSLHVSLLHEMAALCRTPLKRASLCHVTILATLSFFFIPLFAHADPQGLPDRLTAAFEKELRSPLYADANVGICIQDMQGRTLFAKNSRQGFIPASALKALFSGVALRLLGAGYTIHTPVKATGTLEHGILAGDIWLVGQGDPTLETEDLQAAAADLANQGVRQVNGGILYDDTYFEAERNPYAPNARHLYTPPSALNVNYGWIILHLEKGQDGPRVQMSPDTAYARLSHEIRVHPESAKPGKPAMTYSEHPWGDHFTVTGTVTGWDLRYKYLRLGSSRPALFSATLFKEALERKGMKVLGPIGAGRVPQTARTLYVMRGKPLEEALRVLNKESNNLVADTLLRHLGACTHEAPGNSRKGLQAVEEFLEDNVGFAPRTYALADASGLSTANRISPEQFTQVLNFFYNDPTLREHVIESLSRQGHDQYALSPSPPPGIAVYVKSGTLPASGVNTVIGYIILDGSETAYSFALLVNRAKGKREAYSGTYTTPLLNTVFRAMAP